MKLKSRASSHVQCPNCTPAHALTGASLLTSGSGNKTVARSATSKDDLLHRLSRVEGQLRGITRMLEQDRYCVDVLIQISAVRSALDAAAIQLLKDHLGGCVRTALTSGKGDVSINEITEVLQRFLK